METFQQVAAVCFVLGLAILAAYGSRKVRTVFGFRIAERASKRLVLVERLAVSPHHSVCIVRVDGRELVIGFHAGGMSVLKDWREVEERGSR